MQMPIASRTTSVQRGAALRQRDAGIAISTIAAMQKPTIAIHIAHAPCPTYHFFALIALPTWFLKLVNRSAFSVRADLIRSRMFERRSGPLASTESKTEATDCSYGSRSMLPSPGESSRSETWVFFIPPQESCSVVTGFDL